MRVVLKKREAFKAKLKEGCAACRGAGCSVCSKKQQFVDMMSVANIPATYWQLKFKDFSGPANVKKITKDYILNIEDNYENGRGLCYVGQYGTGKTYSICSILKQALLRNHSTYYTSLLDIGHYMRDYKYADDFYHTVTRCDFLAIDEVDSRHFSDSEDSQRFFGSNLERIVRYRIQNELPILLATNNSSLSEVFIGQYKRVIDSLLSKSTEIVPSLGKDHRKR